MAKFSHFDDAGNAIMVDVSHKDETRRQAIAEGWVVMSHQTLSHICAGDIKKGDVFSIAQLAGIMGAKMTSHLIPLCHPLPLEGIKVTLEANASAQAVHIVASCKTSGRTGVEMEALTAVSVAALTVYDMCKALDKAMLITGIRLLEKEGGKSGNFKADNLPSKTDLNFPTTTYSPKSS